MYSYKIRFEKGNIQISGKWTSLKALKKSCLLVIEAFYKDCVVDEIIVFKHRKIHSFRNGDFNIDKTKNSDFAENCKRINDLQEYHKGRAVAENDVNSPYFDVDQAIASFDFDPPDSNFQRGYLRGLIKSGYATIFSKWDGVLV